MRREVIGAALRRGARACGAVSQGRSTAELLYAADAECGSLDAQWAQQLGRATVDDMASRREQLLADLEEGSVDECYMVQANQWDRLFARKASLAPNATIPHFRDELRDFRHAVSEWILQGADETETHPERAMQSYIMLGGDRQHAALRWASFDVLERITVKHDPVIRMLNVQEAPLDPATQLTGSELEELTGQYSRSFADEARRIRAVKAAMMRNLEDCVGYLLSAVEGDVGPDSKTIQTLLREWVNMPAAQRDTEVRKFKGSAVSQARSHVESLLRDLSNPESLERDIVGLYSVESLTTVTPKVLFRDTGLKRLSLRLFAKEVLFLGLYLDKVSAPTHSLFYSVFPEDAVLPTRRPSMLDHPIGKAGFSKREISDTNKYLSVERKYRHARGLDSDADALIPFRENADVRRSMKIDVIAFLLCQADIDSSLFDRPQKARVEDEASASGVSREDPAVPMYNCVDVSMTHYYSTVLEDGRVIRCLQGNEVFLRTRVAVEHGYSSCFSAMTTAELNELLRNRGSGTCMDGIIDFFPYEAFKRTIGAAPEVVAQELWRNMSAEEQTKYGAAFARGSEFANDDDHNPVDTLLPEYAQAGVVPSSLAIFQSFGLLHPYWDCPHGFEAYCSALLHKRRSEGPDTDTHENENEEQEVEEAIRSAIPKWLRLDVQERLAFIGATDASSASDEVLLIRSKVYDVAREDDQRWFFTTRDRFGSPGRQFFKGSEEEWAVLTDGEKFRYHMIAPFAHFDALMNKLSEALNFRYFSTRYLDAQARLTPGMISPYALRQAYEAWALPDGGSSHARCPAANPLHVTPVVPLFPFSKASPSWRGVNLSTQPAAAQALHLLWESDASLCNHPCPDQKVSPLFLRSLLAILRARDPTGSVTIANCFAEAKVRAGLGHLPPGFYNTPEGLTNNAELLLLLKEHCSHAADVSDAYVTALYPTYEPFELYAITENSGFVREHLQKNKTLPTKRILYEQFAGAEIEDQERIAAFCKKQHGSTSDNANVGAFLDFVTGSHLSDPIAFETRVNSLVPVAQRTDSLHHRCAWILKNNADVLADRTQAMGFTVDVIRIVNDNWGDLAVRTLFRSYMLAEKSQWFTNVATNSIVGVDDKRMGGFSHFSGRVLEGFASNSVIEHIVYQLWASLPVNARRLYCRQESLIGKVTLTRDIGEARHWYSVSTHGTAGLAALNVALAEMPLRKASPFTMLLRQQLATLLEVPSSSVQYTDPTLVIAEVLRQFEHLPDDQYAELEAAADAYNASRKAEVWNLVSEERGAGDPAPKTNNLCISLRAQAVLKPLLNIPTGISTHFSCLPIAHFATCLLESEKDPCSAANTHGAPRLSDGTMDKETLLQQYLSLPLNQRLPYVLQARKFALALGFVDTPLPKKTKLAALMFASETLCDQPAYKALPDHRRAFYEKMEIAVLSKYFDASLLQGPCTALGVIASSAENCWMSHTEIEHRFHDLVLQGVPLDELERVALRNRVWGTKYLGCRLHTNVPVATIMCRETTNLLRSLGAKAVLCADLNLPEAEAEDAWICTQIDERATAYTKLQQIIVDTSACITQSDMPPDVPHTHLLPEFPRASDADKLDTLKSISQSLVAQVLSNDVALDQFPYYPTVPSVVQTLFQLPDDQVSLVLSENTSESFWRYLSHYRATHNELYHRVRGLEIEGASEGFQSGGSNSDDFMKSIDQLAQNSFTDGVKLTCFMDYIVDAVRGNSERCYNYAVAEATVVLQRLKLTNFGHSYDPETDSMFAKQVHDAVSAMLVTDGLSEVNGELFDMSNDKDAESAAIETMVMARLHAGELKGHPAFEYWKPLTSRLSFPLFCHAKLTRNIRVEDVFTSAQGHMGLEGEQAEQAAAQVSNAAWTQLSIEEKLPYFAFAGQLRDDFRSEVSRLSGMPGGPKHSAEPVDEDAILLVSQVIENIKEMLHYKERHLRSYELQFERLMPKGPKKNTVMSRVAAGNIVRERLRGLAGADLRKALLDLDFAAVLREAEAMAKPDPDMIFGGL